MRDATSNLRRIFPLRSCSDGGVSRLRPTRASVHRVRDEALPRARAVISSRRRTYAELVERHGALPARPLRGARGRSCARRMRRRGGGRALRGGGAACATRSRRSSARSSASRSSRDKRRSTGTSSAWRGRAARSSVQVLHVREGRVIGAQDYAFSDVRLDDGEVISSFLGQYYGPEDETARPRARCLTPRTIDDDGALRRSARRASGAARRAIRAPQRGIDLRDLVEIGESQRRAVARAAARCEARASTARSRSSRRECSVAARLRRDGSRATTSRRLHGTLTVASARRLRGRCAGNKADYRRYRIQRGRAGGDDLRRACARS